MKIYGILNRNDEIVVTDGSIQPPNYYIQMKNRRPSVQHIANSQGDWILKQNVTDGVGRAMVDNILPLKIYNDEDIDLLPNGFTGLLDFSSHNNARMQMSNLGVVTAHVISAGPTKNVFPRYNHSRIIHIHSYNNDGTYRMYGTVAYDRSNPNSVFYRFDDNHNLFTRRSEFRINSSAGNFSSIDLPNGKRLIEGVVWFYFINGTLLWTLPLAFRDAAYSIMFTDTGSETDPINQPSWNYSIAAMPLDAGRCRLWCRFIHDGRLLDCRDNNNNNMIRIKYFGMGNW